MFELGSLEWYILLFIVFAFSVLLVAFDGDGDDC